MAGWAATEPFEFATWTKAGTAVPISRAAAAAPTTPWRRLARRAGDRAVQMIEGAVRGFEIPHGAVQQTAQRDLVHVLVTGTTLAPGAAWAAWATGALARLAADGEELGQRAAAEPGALTARRVTGTRVTSTRPIRNRPVSARPPTVQLAAVRRTAVRLTAARRVAVRPLGARLTSTRARPWGGGP